MKTKLRFPVYEKGPGNYVKLPGSPKAPKPKCCGVEEDNCCQKERCKGRYKGYCKLALAKEDESTCKCGCLGCLGDCFSGGRTRCKPFIVVNLIAAQGHLFNFVYAIARSTEASRGRTNKLKKLVTLWQYESAYCNDTCAPEYYRVTNGDNETFTVQPFDTKEYSEFSVYYLVLAFHFLSFFFQFAVAFSPFYVKNVLEKGTNGWRFVEYSISASIMLVCIAIVSGILEYTTILSVATLTFITQILGLVSEQLFRDGNVRLVEPDPLIGFDGTEEDAKRKLAERLAARSRNKKPIYDTKSNILNEQEKEFMRYLGWIAHFGGWVTMIVAYYGIVIQHFTESVEHSEGVDVPEFVTVAVWIVFVFFNLFGVTAFFQLCLKDPGCSTICERWGCGKANLRDGREDCVKRCPCCGGKCCKRFSCCVYENMSINEWVEMFYVFLSLTSKTVLGTLILVNVLGEQGDMLGKLETCDSR